LLCINYTFVIIMWINSNNNNTIINNNCGRLQDFILLFKISMSSLKNFFEIYREFGYVAPKRLARLTLEFTDVALKIQVSQLMCHLS